MNSYGETPILMELMKMGEMEKRKSLGKCAKLAYQVQCC